MGERRMRIDPMEQNLARDNCSPDPKNPCA